MTPLSKEKLKELTCLVITEMSNVPHTDVFIQLISMAEASIRYRESIEYYMKNKLACSGGPCYPTWGRNLKNCCGECGLREALKGESK